MCVCVGGGGGGGARGMPVHLGVQGLIPRATLIFNFSDIYSFDDIICR